MAVAIEMTTPIKPNKYTPKMDTDNIIVCVEAELPNSIEQKFLNLLRSYNVTSLFLHGTRNHGERKKKMREMNLHPEIYVVLDKQTVMDQSIVIHEFNKTNVVPGKIKPQFARFGMTYGIIYMTWILHGIRCLPDDHIARVDYSKIYRPESVDQL